MKKNIYRISALLLLIVSGCGKSSSESPAGGDGAPQMPPAVVVAGTVEHVAFEDVIQGLGTAEARESIEVTATVTERVKDIHFQEGQPVKEGVLLVELENAEETAALKEAEVQLKQEKRELKRIKGLVKKDAASEARLDKQETLFEAAKTRKAAAESRWAERNLVAPFAGRLGIRHISVGDLVSPGTVITTLDDIEVMKVTFTVPEVYYPQLAKGQVVNAHSAAYTEELFTGAITAIDSRIDPVSRAVTVRAEIPNQEQKLLPGMFLTVDVLKATRESLAVPEGALVQQGKAYTVMGIGEGNVIQPHMVEIGARKAGAVEILSGLTEGGRIVVEGVQKAWPGMPVHIQGEAPPEMNPSQESPQPVEAEGGAKE